MDTIGERYRFVCVIGEGAFSRVYLAEDGKGRRFACKVSEKVEMLEREAEILSRLYHPLFPAYVGYEEQGGVGRLVMEYIPGRSLEQMARIRGGISARQTMRIAGELADGLRYLHERQPAVLYRDLKPGNILVCQDGHIRLVDMGCVCRQDVQGEVRVGTPGFAPPEQMSAGGTAGLYSDIYSLGRVVQSVMRDERAGGGEERMCRRRLESMIEECTREDPRQRPQDMISVSLLLAGKRKRERGILCEKNIWESSCKNSCSLPLI